jgi:hypothetical protein
MNDKIANIDAHIIDDIRTIITKARSKAYQSINEALIRSNWEIGKRIVEEEQLGKQRADYGIQLIKSISQQLTTEFGSGYGVRNLAYFKQLYQYFPDWEILHTRVQNLTFLGLSRDMSFSESELESAIITHLQKFLMEMGKGYAFVERQQHIITDTQDYYIDLVFYNYLMKCFVLIDLKTTKITHQDVGQMDMYVRMYDELKRTEGDNPTIGILLCSETSQDIARFSILHDSKQLFASKYLTYLPTEQQLKEEIEKQKEIFRLQHIR